MSAEEWIVAASVANAALVAVLVVATIFYAAQTLRTVSELREARIIETLPVLWQRHPGSAGRPQRTPHRMELDLAK